LATLPRPRSLGDRLSSTLFFAVLAHGVVILGVTFSPGAEVEAPALPSLKVTLLVDSADQQPLPEDAEYLAQRNQRGAGAAAAGLRPTTAIATDEPVAPPGDASSAESLDGAATTPASIEQLATRAAAARRVRADPQLLQPAEMAIGGEERRPPLIAHLVPRTLVTELDDTAQLPEQSESRTLIATPATQSSPLATYLDGWRRRVERIGTANFPAQFLGEGTGRPTLEVVLASDGRLEDIIVRRSSGNKALDQAALKILRLAAPFEPLPQELRARYDTLRFAYEWDFDAGSVSADTTTAAATSDAG
jgi:protein TonB